MATQYAFRVVAASFTLAATIRAVYGIFERPTRRTDRHYPRVNLVNAMGCVDLDCASPLQLTLPIPYALIPLPPTDYHHSPRTVMVSGLVIIDG